MRGARGLPSTAAAALLMGTLLMLGATREASAAPVVVVPNTFYAGTDAKLSAHTLERAVTVSLKTQEGQLVASANVEQSAEPQVVALAVPAGVAGAHRVIVTETANPDSTIGEESTITVQPANFVLMIELDKLVYKPGDEMRARVIAVDPSLMPATSQDGGKVVTVELWGPQGFILRKWNEMTMDAVYGVAEVIFQSSDSIKTGQYKLKAYSDGSDSASNVMTERSFMVEEYVLPRFEVTVSTVTDSISTRFDSFAGTVSAKTTYGQGVQGSVTMQVRLKPQQWWGWGGGFLMGPARVAEDAVSVPSGGGAGKALYTMTATMEGGEYDFTLSSDAFSLEGQYGDVEILATVTEWATGETQNGTASVSVSSSSYMVELTGAPFFQPGLPYHISAQVLSTKPGDPLPATLDVKVTLSGRYSWQAGENADAPGLPWNQDLSLAVDAAGRASVAVELPAEDSQCCFPANGVSGNDEADSCCQLSLSAYASGWAGGDVATWEEANVQAGGSVSASRATSPSGHYMRAAQLPTLPEAPDALRFEYTVTSYVPKLSFAVLGRLGVVAVGLVTPDAQATTGQFVVDVAGMRAHLAPSANLLMWHVALPDNGTKDEPEVVVARVPIMDNTIAHQLSASFVAGAGEDASAAVQAEPGEAVQVAVAADGATRVYIMAVDKSVRLQAGASSELTAQQLLQGASRFTPPDGQPNCAGQVAEREAGAAGVALLSSALVPACSDTNNGGWGGDYYVDDLEEGVAQPARGQDEDAGAEDDNGGGQASEGTMRQNFPESWLWKFVDVGPDGSAVTLDETAPDTITTWELSAFGISPTMGVGVANVTSDLTVFKPFFVEPALPYSIVRGETATVRVGVFNYMTEDATVSVTMTLGPELELADGSATASMAVSAGATAAATFRVRAAGIGVATVAVEASASGEAARRDSVQRTVRVVAEGVHRTAVVNRVLMGAEAASQELSIALPENVVEGSLRTSVQVIGDMMAQSFDTKGLVTQPSGCGEQNMIGMAPNTYVVQYMEATGKVDADVRARAVRFMGQGYQRELNYRHTDGSYSAFGEGTAEGSTWLTAFVTKVFAQSAPYMQGAVSSEVLADGIRWLEGMQVQTSRDASEVGSFRSSGNVIHTEMQGGTSSGVSLTAFVLVALLHAGQSSAATLDLSVEYLQRNVQESGHFATVISAYALALACNKSNNPDSAACGYVPAALDLVDAIAITEGGLTHWEPAAREADGPSIERRSAYGCAVASHIELTGYGLMAYTVGNRMGAAFPVAKWMLQQRNSLGGFSSTQDTVVALEALSAYAAGMTAAGTMTVTATSSNAWTHTYTIDEDNRSVLQKQDISPTPTNTSLQVTVTATSTNGEGMAIVQLVADYNVMEEVLELPPVYELNVTWRNSTDQVDIMIAEACANMIQEDVEDPGMVIMEVSCFSGYQVVRRSLNDLVEKHRKKGVMRADISEDKQTAQIYIQALDSAQLCFDIHALKVDEVENLQPAVSKVEAYYDSSMKTTRLSAIADVGVVDDSGDTPPKVKPSPPPQASTPSPRGSPTTPTAVSTSSASRSMAFRSLWELTLMALAVVVMLPLVWENNL